jgi:tRNA-splicing ligase RtcB
MRRPDPLESHARSLALQAGYDPDGRIPNPLKPGKTMPIWTTFRRHAREEAIADRQRYLHAQRVEDQDPAYADAPLAVLGVHEPATIEQMRACMRVGNVVAGVLCADGHLGYAMPVGGVIAYEGQISISGVGFDIACGNLAVRLDTRFDAIRHRTADIMHAIRKEISFGVGRSNATLVEHPLFDDEELWISSGMRDYKSKAQTQLGTVGSGNHYIDLFHDEDGHVWIGVHFGSRGLGHTAATRYLKAAGGKDGIHVPPVVVNEMSEIGARYLAAMVLAGDYAYAGREWVVERVRSIIGGEVVDRVHNHHNFAWQEEVLGRRCWVVRKGATPAYQGQRGFVGGSMGDHAVILVGTGHPAARHALYSTVHGAGRVVSRKEAHRRFTREQMALRLTQAQVMLWGGDLDESPMAYRRLDEVLHHHRPSVRIERTLTPFAVLMAGPGEFDPWKD